VRLGRFAAELAQLHRAEDRANPRSRDHDARLPIHPMVEAGMPQAHGVRQYSNKQSRRYSFTAASFRAVSRSPVSTPPALRGRLADSAGHRAPHGAQGRLGADALDIGA